MLAIMINHIFALNDFTLNQIISELDKPNQKGTSIVCRLFHNLVTQNQAENNSLILSRKNYIDKFFQNQVPGLNTTYQHVLDAFVKEGIDVYINGGAIRDLLGMRTSRILDIDFSFTGEIDKIVEIAQKNLWKFSKRPDFPVIQIGDRKECCLQGIPVKYTLKAPIESLEFCLNNVIYHYNTKEIIDRTGKGFDAILSRKLNIAIEDKVKWLAGSSLGTAYNRIFRFWKMIGRGFVPDPSLYAFVYSKSKDLLKQDREKFLQDMALNLGIDYGDFDSHVRGCALLMGIKWKDQVIVPMENEILSCFKKKKSFGTRTLIFEILNSS